MIVVFGSINVDFVFAVPHLPREGETVLGTSVTVQPGGKGANQAVASARDGAQVLMVGAVGRDPMADVALTLMRDSGVDLSRVGPAADGTGCAAICTDPHGRNQIAVGSGANWHARAEMVEDSLLAPGTTLLLQMEVRTEENIALIARARRLGARIVLNLAPAAELDVPVLRQLDALVVNEHEAAWLAGQLGTDPTRLHEALEIVVVRTLGEHGAAYASADETGIVPAMSVPVVDTTAAGDCFTGVFAAALDRGLPLDAAIRRANVAAALCCQVPGSQASLPKSADIDAALASDLPPLQRP